jgi:hypothetical protein
MHSTFASLSILVLILSAVGVSHAGADTTDSVTLFAVGDVADCRARNPSLISTESLDKEELAEHRIETSTWLPQEPLLIEELIEDEPGIVLALGDLAYPAGTLDQYKDCFAKVWRRVLTIWNGMAAAEASGIDRDKPVSELQCEANNLLFAKHGLPQIAVRWMPGD